MSSKKYNIERSFIRKSAKLCGVKFKHVPAASGSKSHYIVTSKAGIVLKAFQTFKAAFYFTMANGLILLAKKACYVDPTPLQASKKVEKRARALWLKFNPSIGELNGNKFYITSKTGQTVYVDLFQSV